GPRRLTPPDTSAIITTRSRRSTVAALLCPPSRGVPGFRGRPFSLPANAASVAFASLHTRENPLRGRDRRALVRPSPEALHRPDHDGERPQRHRRADVDALHAAAAHPHR